jgi:large subunit ribosomal protein L19
MDKMKIAEEQYTKKDIPGFKVGDTVKVMVKILEADKTRLHPFEGIVIAKKGTGIKSMFTVRKVSYGEGIERVFPVYSPSIDRIEIIRKGKIKRAKLYYLRERIGKKATQVDTADTTEKSVKTP